MADTPNNPMNFFQGMWKQMGFQLPGMVTPTLDEGELEKQISDLKSVENWLRMNLSMLQMTIQNLEMQKSALGTFRTMGEHFTPQPSNNSAPENAFNPFFQMAGATAQSNPANSFSSSATAPNANGGDETLSKAAMWPWEMMNELNAKLKEQMTNDSATSSASPCVTPSDNTPASTTKKPDNKKTDK